MLGIRHRDAARINPFDGAGDFQLFKLATDGFQPQPEVIRHLGAAERQRELTGCLVFVPAHPARYRTY